MRLLDRLESWFGRFAVPNLTAVVIVAQMIAFAFSMRPDESGEWGDGSALQPLWLIPRLVLQGEVWRVVTFLAVPPITNVVFLLFGWYAFYLMGTSLEHYWGTFRFNLFILSGWAATVAASFLQPDVPATAVFFEGSVFLAFAHLNPYFTIYLFFLLPVQIRWIALLTWVVYFLTLLTGPWWVKLTVLASILNFLLFFGTDVFDRIRTARRHMAGQAARFGAEGWEPAYHHRCKVCGVTDADDRQMEFRYCSKCDDGACYCVAHLRDHQHTTAVKPG
ncbi:MAG: hypothetical protein ACRC33_17400 [Gemmataceae bacterium]